MASERIQKILARAGITSRRKAEELIVEGLITVNGKIAKLGDKAEIGKDAIKVKGKLLHQPKEAPVYLVLYKPKGVISMLADQEGRPTLADYLDKIKTRVFPIGRLDFNSEGLILLTNDGDYAEKVQKRDDIPRVYTIKVKGHPDQDMLARIKRGARVGFKKKFVKPHSVDLIKRLQSKSLIQVVMLGSGAFDVKGLFDTTGFLVEKVTRSGIGHITLGELAPGDYRLLKNSQAQALLDQPELGIKRLANEAFKRLPKKVREKRE